MDRMEQSLSGVSARFDELTARFESSIASLNDTLRTQAADLAAHNDQYSSRFAQIERAFESLEMTLSQQSVRLTALEQTAGWVSSVMANVTQANMGASGSSSSQQRSTFGASYTSPGSASAGTSTGGATTASTSSAATAATSGTGTGGSTDNTGGSSSSGGDVKNAHPQYPAVSNASSYVGASLQAGGAILSTPDLQRGWTQLLAFAPAAVGLVDDMVADVDNKKAIQRAAASALAGGALLLVAKAIK